MDTLQKRFFEKISRQPERLYDFKGLGKGRFWEREAQ